MSTALSYADAVQVLGGGKQNKVVNALDRLAGGALLLVSATGSALALSLFDAKSEFFRLTNELVSGVIARVRRSGPVERGEQLAAAHSVIVVASFFDAMAAVRLPFDFAEIGLSSSDNLTSALLHTPVPLPAPHRPYEKSIEELGEFYDHTADEVLRFLTGLEVWDRLDDRARRAVEHAMDREVVERALARYEDLFRQLATDFPEVAFWANLVDHQATRVEIGELRTALAGVAEGLAKIAAERAPDENRRRPALSHQQLLQRPLLPTAPDGVRLPTIADAYVNPHFRVAGDGYHDHIADERWWDEQPVRTDLQGFLIGHLTSPAATQAPLVVLGQPGSGKSMLTKVLAARLPASEFAAVQVPLREVSADRDLQTQLEHGLRITTGEHLRWPDFVRSLGDAVPVVLLDGFDELLQATKMSQSNYLQFVAEFQRREAAMGRPVVVVVTSRVSVADRARPVDGMVSLLLEPFDDEQIERWLEPWRRANNADLTLDVLRPHAELARQPLLLLLLAIYDHTESPLSQHGGVLGRTQLYERLLAGFARREVLKEHANEPDDVVAGLVEEQLVRLSVAAFAMFNRGQQWVSADELDGDLAALHVGRFGARVVIGSFYFIHTAQAIKDDHVRLRTYEFMHPTFGEYLIARHTVRELRALAAGDRDNDDLFHGLLSFAPLTARRTVTTFISILMSELPEECRQPIRDTLLSLFHTALLRRRSFLPGYEPGSRPVVTRCAVYSANLCVLLVSAPPFEVTADELFPHVEDPAGEWSRTATLWMSQLPTEGWHGLVDALDLFRSWQGDRRSLRISGPHRERRQVDLYWTYRVSPEDHSRGEGNYRGWINVDFDAMSAQLEFMCSVEGDTAAHALSPFSEELGSMVTTFYAFGDAPPVSAAQALMSLWLKADGIAASTHELTTAYHTCLLWAVHGFAPNDTYTRRHFRVLFLNQLQRLRGRLPASAVNATVDMMLRIDGPEIEDKDELLALTRDICPGLLD